eukprot:CAMPEP_0172641576 /NCGR_PEP_ID=MMETSP1068-20121228/227974_1 /TAXON_ID=35684 /ORGANISM="Pseudopedinella elastica, Strain CCMP716" /LENGTH=108 /DNA_ID=CAMNT_0013455193 /DNA_START=108 /DNA_END=430 /DNA_ORIENTATION=+
MASKWRARREATVSADATPGPSTRNKRDNHPSPAVGSPAAELLRANGKRTDTRLSPAWKPSDVDGEVTKEQVNAAQLLADNQRAFAARFAAPPTPALTGIIVSGAPVS